jgi:Tfp pilus assembly protein PilF
MGKFHDLIWRMVQGAFPERIRPPDFRSSIFSSHSAAIPGDAVQIPTGVLFYNLAGGTPVAQDRDPEIRKRQLELLAQSSVLRMQHCHEEALKCLDEAMEMGAGFLPILIEQASILSDLGRLDESVRYFNRAIRWAGDEYAQIVRKLRNNVLQEALESSDAVNADMPGAVDNYLKKADIFHNLGKFEEAVRTCDSALAIDPSNAAVLNRRGNALLELDKREEARECYERALETTPEDARIVFNLGRVYQLLGSFEKAFEIFSRALSIEPGLAEAAVEQSHCLLTTGDFKRGWPLYEARWKTGQFAAQMLQSSSPLWLGGDSLKGKTILLWAEQGFGDTIQFLRFVPLVTRLEASVTLLVQPTLKKLGATLKCPLTILEYGEKLPPHDFHCPLMSLPLALGTVLETVPTDVPYLSAPDEYIEKWRSFFKEPTGPRIGIVWLGRRTEPQNRSRDLPLELLRPFADMKLRLVSLQQTLSEQDKQVLETLPGIIRTDGLLRDFSDTAALIENLDLVISVDTAAAHLAGSLGKPVWLVLRDSGEWRWLTARSDSVWYPTMRIFRQETAGDWAGVIRRIEAEIKSMPGNV